MPKKIEIQDVEDFEERESDSNEDEFCPECNNYVGKKGSFIKNNFKQNFIIQTAVTFALNALKVLVELLCGEGPVELGTESG